MPDPLFADLYRDTEHLSWAPTDQVRRRGRQRIRRTRIAAGLASVVAVAVVAGGVAALAGGRDAAPLPVTPGTGSPTPTSTPSTDPGPTRSPSAPSRPDDASPSRPPQTSSRPTTSAADPAIPTAAMLQNGDGPSGYRVAGGDIDGDWNLAFSAAGCARADHPLFRLDARAERGRRLSGGPDRMVLQRVERLSPRDADRYLGLVRDRVDSCGGESVTLTVVASGFAGEESVLVRARYTSGGEALHLFVRQGDLVSELWQKGLTDPAASRELGRDAARRLCAGIDSC
ncbi:hypothetical protein ACFT9M_17635 [Micromonospora purpureochromogenes]|uniref:hypothetical protein n=1 Tax=Micromonospora purpureochromogenes TaxID=47872 RepID=UPI00364194D3